MKFCANCKKTLILFEFHEDGLCNNCLTLRKEKVKPIKANPKQDYLDLSDCILSCENGKVILSTSEGLILWSSPVEEKNKLGNILDRAQRILKIRSKRR